MLAGSHIPGTTQKTALASCHPAPISPPLSFLSSEPCGQWDNLEAQSAEDKGGICHLEVGPRHLSMQSAFSSLLLCLLATASWHLGYRAKRGQMWGLRGTEQKTIPLLFFSPLYRPLEHNFSGKARAAFFPLCPRVKGRAFQLKWKDWTEGMGLGRAVVFSLHSSCPRRSKTAWGHDHPPSDPSPSLVAIHGTETYQGLSTWNHKKWRWYWRCAPSRFEEFVLMALVTGF